MRSVTGAVALLLVISACSGNDAAPGSTTTTSTSVPVPSTESTEPPTTSSTTTSPTTEPNPPLQAELVISGGPILTMDPGLGTVEAVAVSDGRITAVGDAEEIAPYIGDDTTTIGLNGRALLPGFVDPHTHLLSDAGEPILIAQQTALANGITSLADASVEPELLDQLLAVQDDLVIHVGMYLGRTTYCGEDLGTWYEEYAPRRWFGEHLFVAGVKIFSDGGACGLLASSEPFIEDFPIGPPFHSFEALTAMIRTADEAGYQLLIHAQGDLAVRDVQNALEIVLDGRSNTLRHRIDHNSIVTPELRGRYSEIGIIPVVFGSFYTCADIAWTDFWRTGVGENWRALLDANPGLTIAWHGDDPSLPPVLPLFDLASLVTRGDIAEDGSYCEPPPWLAATAITVEEALPMMTLNSAFALGLDDEVGSITPGKLADFVIVSADPTAVGPRELFDLTVVATFVDGVPVFCSDGNEAICRTEPTVRGLTASASMSRSAHGPELVLDGVVGGESFWSSGADAPQWLQLDFAEPTAIDRVRFVVFQSPASDTIHELEVLVNGEWRLVETFAGFTEAGDVLEWVGEGETISALRVTTLESLSWPEWYEIEVETSG